MPKQRIILIVGIILAVLAVLMTKVYIDQQRGVIIEDAKKKLANMQAQIQANQSVVMVAKSEIPKGVVIEPEMLKVEIVPNQYIQPQAVTSLDRIAGMMTVLDISKGEQITLTKLTYPKQQVGGGLSGLTPVGKRAVTISVDNLAAVGGMLKPGDYVDVMALVAVPMQTKDKKPTTQVVMLPLFQNVLVLAVGQDIGQPQPQEARYKKGEERQEVSPLITLALTPQEANLIAFIQEQGKIRLVLRSPADSKIEAMQPAGWDTLFQYIMPQELVEPKPGEESKVTYVEIYRGLSKERIPISGE